MGIPVTFSLGSSVFAKRYAALFSDRINRFSEQSKRKLIFAFILLSVSLTSAVLIQGLYTENKGVLPIPVWEPPVIYYDSLLHQPLNNILHETHH
ncbi:hypothetical protein [Algoriphagus ratkowskyi]|nr:hypothetical protein [Algoriphagus ratkowskyi]TXD77399.1 hypothetical protein ESW18_11365 [Algoriphagus ratkowskyi]